MKASHAVAILIVLGAAVWIGSGVLGRQTEKTGESAPVDAAAKAAETAPFRVGVMPVTKEKHARQIVLSGRTEADRRVSVVARTNGIIEQLPIRRGSLVKQGETLAALSDEAREAMVSQARARLEQRRAELTARLKLIEQGNLPVLQKPVLEAEMRAAEALFAQAEVERDRNIVQAPFDGIVNELHVREGQALQIGSTVADIIALSPMLAVVEIAERDLNMVKPGGTAEVTFIDGRTIEGRVRFVSAAASARTRTYRVDVELPNNDGTIPDGVTCEVRLVLAEVEASAVPRSALTFSANGQLGVRTVEDGGLVAFTPVQLAEDGQQKIWVTGMPDEAQVIVQGQDFVKEGQTVEPVPVSTTARRG